MTLIAKAIVGRRDAVVEADKENDEIRDTTIKLLKDQNEQIIRQNDLLEAQNKNLEATNDEMRKSVGYLTTQVTNLGSKVSNLTIWFNAIACLRAPTCNRRDCPDRFTFAQISEGDIKPEDLVRKEEEE